MTAGGIVAGTAVTKYVADNYSDKLPMWTNADGTPNLPAQIGYRIVIPGITGLVVRKYSRSLSDGLILGGLAFGAMAALAAYAPPGVKSVLGMSEYIGAGTAFRPLSASINGPGGAVAFRGAGSVLGGGASPFKNSNWG